MNPDDRRVPLDSSDRHYIERAPDISCFAPAFRQALMAVEPAFFGWDAREQDRYRRDMPGEACKRLDQRLGNATAGSDPDDAQQDNRINTLKLPLFGIGQDFFYLNEPGSGWYDMETVADLSREHFESDPERDENKLPFMGQFYPAWCRYLRRDRLVYATLISFHHHLLDAIAKRHDTLVERLIPHRYVTGRDHGKKTKGGYLWDTKRDANGLEGQLDELMTRAWNIQSTLYLRALEDCHARGSGQVFRVVTSDGVDAMTNWVFDGLKAMQGVRLTHFLEDAHAHRASRRTLSGLLGPYLEEADARLQHEYEDIMRNWDPKLATLKRKRKIVMSEQVASDLLGEDID